MRFVAPSSVYQMRQEVFAADGAKAFDSDVTFGNVLDLPSPGADEAALLSPFPNGAGRTTSLLAHDGGGGLLVSGSGGLSFRLGDYFAGQDVERMRLSEQGNLGIGVATPKAKLDVDGVIRTSKGFRFPDGTLQTTAAGHGAPVGATAPGLTPVFDALGGTGTTNFLAKWTSSTGIGSSTIVDVGGDIGVGTTTPGGVFDLQRASTGDILQRFWNTSTGGAKLRYVAGNGATSQLQMTDFDEWLAAIAVDQTRGLEGPTRDSNHDDRAQRRSHGRSDTHVWKRRHRHLAVDAQAGRRGWRRRASARRRRPGTARAATRAQQRVNLAGEQSQRHLALVAVARRRFARPGDVAAGAQFDCARQGRRWLEVEPARIAARSRPGGAVLHGNAVPAG